MSNLVEHARRELKLLGETDQAYVDGILKMIQAFADMGHSGGSASVAIPTINALLQFKNLTPLTDNPNEWTHISDDMTIDGKSIWQNNRNPEAFSNDKGKTYYLLSEGGSNLNRQPLHESAKALRYLIGE
jgi:hypothetical protein